MHNHINFAKEYIVIKLKTLKEYKTNIYCGTLGNLTFMIILFLTYSILKQNLKELFYWNLKEFILFAIFLELFLFIFAPWFRHLPKILLKGDLNKYLTRPLNPFMQYSFEDLDITSILYSSIYIIAAIIYFIFIVPEFHITKFITIVTFATFGGIFYSSLNCTINNLAFFMKKNQFIKDARNSSEYLFSQYPISFFKNTPIQAIALFIPIVYYSAFVTDYYFGYIQYKELFNLFIILISLITICTTTSYFLWKTGIKKYEAFG